MEDALGNKDRNLFYKLPSFKFQCITQIILVRRKLALMIVVHGKLVAVGAVYVARFVLNSASVIGRFQIRMNT